MKYILLKEYDKLTKEHYKIFILSLVGWMFDIYDLTLFVYLTIPIMHELGISNFWISIAVGVTLLSTAIGGILFGALADKYGRKKVLQWTIIVYSIGTLLCGFTWSATSLIIFRIITGIGVGGEWATGQTYINETFPSKFRGKYGGIMQAGSPLGILLASVVAALLLPVIGWRLCFIISVLPAIIIIFIRTGLHESDLWLKNKKNNISSTILKKFKILINKDYKKVFFLSLILCIFGMTAPWFIYTWLPNYLQVDRGLSLTISAVGIIFMQVGSFVGYFLFGYISDCIGRRVTVTIYALIMTIGISSITVMWNYIATSQYHIFIFMLILGFGTGYLAGFGPLLSEIFPTEIRNTGMGTVFNLSRGFQFLTPIIIYLISQYYGMSSGIFLGAIFSLLLGFWIWVFPETNGRDIEVIDKKSEVEV